MAVPPSTGEQTDSTLIQLADGRPGRVKIVVSMRGRPGRTAWEYADQTIEEYNADIAQAASDLTLARLPFIVTVPDGWPHDPPGTIVTVPEGSE